MNSQSFGLRVAGLIFGLMCLVHLWRLLFSDFITVQIGSHVIPHWVSGVGAIVAGILSIWMFRLSASRGG
jgi:tetrahydromethanopterin S-methyltransferase subunit E